MSMKEAGRWMAAWAFVALPAAAALLALDPAAQQPTGPAFRGGIDVVNVDVTVLDKNRRPVRGLTAADFTVLENGEPRSIVTFSAVDLPAPVPSPGGTAPWLRSVASDVSSNEIAPDGRLVVILFDWAIRQVDLGAARNVAAAAINALGPNDLGGVVFSHGFRNGGIRQNFTSDKGMLLDAISRPITGAPIDADGELLDMEETFDVVDTPSCMCGVCAYEKWPTSPMPSPTSPAAARPSSSSVRLFRRRRPGNRRLSRSAVTPRPRLAAIPRWSRHAPSPRRNWPSPTSPSTLSILRA
jgi:hypothetical protein